MKPIKHLTHIELLEDRIAPATIINPFTVTFKDGSGDTAVVNISKPLFKNATAAGKILIFTDNNGNTVQESFTGNGAIENLAEINLLARADAQDLSITVKVIPQVGVGDLQVNVGLIAAANFSVADQVSQNIDLGNIYIQGNLGQITAGDNFSTPAIQSLKVLSMNQALQSDVLGTITNMNVQGDFNANLSVIGYQFGSIGKLTIGGSLAGDTAGDQGSGVIQFTGRVGAATIGNITGTAASNTGELLGTSANPSSIGSLVVTGSITGGGGADSGQVFAQAGIGKISVTGSVIGGSGQNSGEIAGPLGTVNITGNLTGGSGISSGAIFSEVVNTAQNAVAVPMGSVTIGGSIMGGSAGVAAAGSTASTPGDSGIISAFSARSITIGGSLIGGTPGTGTNTNGTLDQTADTSGAILVNSVQSLTIVGNIIGGGGPDSGVITGQSLLPAMKYGSISVSGGITGGSGAISGAIEVNGLLGGTITNLHIGETVIGGSGTQSGQVLASTLLGTVFVGGDVIGGTANNTGEIFTNGSLTNGLIKGNLSGNTAIDSSNAVLASGYIQAGHIGTLNINGNVTSGVNKGTGGLANSGAIRSTADILSLTIGGAVTGTAANPVVISAQNGPVTAGIPKTDLAIKSVTIDQNVAYLNLLAGYGPTIDTSSSTTNNVTTTTIPAGAALGTPSDGTAQIGTVTFGGDLSASNVVAGVTPGSSGFFGTSKDTAIAASTANAALFSTIASIIVDGTATGDSTPTDSFGFVAQQVTSVQVGSTAVALHSGPNNDHLVVVSGNLVVNEVPAA
jgi:hypothetical protein